MDFRRDVSQVSQQHCSLFFSLPLQAFSFSFSRYLRNVTVAQGDGKPDIAFSSDGTLKSVELKIMNLRPDGRSNQDLIWEQVNFHLTIKNVQRA